MELPIRNRNDREEPILLLLSDIRERVFHFFTNKVTFPEFLADVIYHVFECGIINSFDFNLFLNMNETTLLEKITTAFPRLLETSEFSIKFHFIFSSPLFNFLDSSDNLTCIILNYRHRHLCTMGIRSNHNFKLGVERVSGTRKSLKHQVCIICKEYNQYHEGSSKLLLDLYKRCAIEVSEHSDEVANGQYIFKILKKTTCFRALLLKNY